MGLTIRPKILHLLTVMKRSVYHLLFLIGLFILCLSYQFLVSLRIDPQCSMDAAYYHIIARRLSENLGFTEPFIWNHLKPYARMVHDVDFWQPAGIVFYALSRFFAGDKGEIWLNIIIWSLLAVAVFRAVYRISSSIAAAFFSYTLFVFGGKYGFYVSTTDNIVFYAFLGFWWFQFSQEAQDGYVSGIKVGIISGLMALTRVEGLLFGILACVENLFIKKRFKVAVGVFFACVLVVSPWVIRNYEVLGVPWPSQIKALLLRDYSDMFENETTGTWQYYFQDGFLWVLRHKLKSLFANLAHFVLIPNYILFVPLWFIGLFYCWNVGGKRVALATLILWFLNGVLFTTQSLKGTAFHIAAAFLPHGFIFCALGLERCIDKFYPKEKRKKMWVFVGILLFWAAFFTYFGFQASLRSYNNEKKPYSDFVRKYKFNKDDKIVSSFPIMVNLLTSCPGIVAPSKNINGPLNFARKFDCDYILLDSRAGHKIPDTFEHFPLVASEPPLFLFAKIKASERK